MRYLSNVYRLAVVWAVVALSACTGTDEPEVSTIESSVTVGTSQASYAVDTPITVTWTDMPGHPYDWVAIRIPADADDETTVYFTYTGGTAAGSATFSDGIGTAGTYEVRAYGGGSFVPLATSSFTVTSGTPPPTAGVSTNQTSYPIDTPITVNWTNMPGNPYDWVALRVAGDANDDSVVYFTYTGGTTNGSFTFMDGIGAAGNYEARAYAGGSFVPLATSSFTVAGAPAPQITTNKSIYAVNEDVTVSWTNMPGNPYDYVSLEPAGSPPGSLIRWNYTGGSASGTMTFAGLPNGNYEARAYQAGTSTILDSSTFSVVTVSATISTNKSAYAVNETITASWTGAPSNPYTVVALTAAGAPADNGSMITWTYTNGAVSGSHTFQGLSTPGNYEVRLYEAGTFNILASTTFSVGSGGSCTVGSTGPVFESLTTGELVIGTTESYKTVQMSPALDRSILFTSVRENEGSPRHGSVSCRLRPEETFDVSGVPVVEPAGVTCVRNSSGTDTGSGTITVRYTVVTFTSGVTVQRGVAETHATNPVSVSLSTIDPAQSFVLLGGVVNGGSGWGNNEFVRATLSGSTLELRTAAQGTQVAWQVVTMAGASVQRGTASLASGATSQSVTIATAPSGSMVLASYTSDNPSGIAAASIMMQTRLSSATSIEFSRTAGGSNLSVSWEVVSLPFATYSGTTSFASGVTTATVPVSGSNFSAASSVALASTQSLFGPSSGSTSYIGSEYDLVGEAAFTLAAGTNSVTLQRASAQSSATLPWTVIDFAHNCDGT